MLMQTIKTWGNGLAVRLPKAVARQVGLKQGDEVSLNIQDGEIILRPTRPAYRLDELLAGITKDNQPEPVEFSPVGKELL